MSKTTSPTNAGNVCMCKDGSYSPDCCNGKIYQQGIGSLEGGSESTVTDENTTRTITRN